MQFGKHYLIEFVNCDQNRIDAAHKLEDVFLEAVKRSGATYLSHTIHKFDPQGVTILVLVGESHFSIHTWPEKNYAAMDIFSCSDSIDVNGAVDYIQSFIDAEKSEIKIVERGY